MSYNLQNKHEIVIFVVFPLSRFLRRGFNERYNESCYNAVITNSTRAFFNEFNEFNESEYNESFNETFNESFNESFNEVLTRVLTRF